MACVDELHIDDEGTSIQLEVVECMPDGTEETVDITNASTLVVRFQKSDKAKTTIDKTATIYSGGTNGNGTDGLVEYITEADLVDVTGTWKAQAIVTFQASGRFHSSIVDIKVVKNLATPL